MGGHEPDGAPWSRVEGTLMSTARAIRRAYDRALADLDVNLAEASVLAHLGNDGPMAQVQLARRIGAGRARIGAHVDALEGKGAVRREADPTDRRVWLVTLTPTGEKLWKRSVLIDRAVRDRLRAGTTSQERAQLDRLLLTIQKNVSELLEEDH